ncbi:MAG: MBL fold metallo-hydrolase [Candidatus Eisenbacteria bacterium]|nr:MBL fold metallo-hydrolase [Candidatus Eisenbacteria bacterium]
MGRARLFPIAFAALAMLCVCGCSDSEVNPYDPQQDQEPPVVTSFTYSGGEAQWSTDEEALCVLEYGPVGGDYENYVYESTKYFSTYHRVELLGAEDGEEYKVRVRSRDRAGNEAYEASAQLPATIVGRTARNQTMSLSMIDVGWGLAVVITTPDGSRALIDAGADYHLPDVLEFVQGEGIGYFDAAVVTHYHGDHVGGFAEEGGVLDVFGVGGFVAPDFTTAYIPMWGSLEERLLANGIPVTYVQQGHSSDNTPALDWDGTPGFRVEVLGAAYGGLIGGPEDTGQEGMKGNNDSIVLRITWGGVSYVVTGDAEYFAEYDIVDTYGRQGSRADLLQIGHHGNDDASSELWLENVSPRIALISNAMIEAQLQKEVVTQGIRAVDADYFVTDRIYPNTPRNVTPTYGNIIAVTDGETIEIVLEPDPW